MNKRGWTKWTTIVAAMIFAFSLGLAGNVSAEAPAAKAEADGAIEIKGQVKAVSNKAKTVSVTVGGKGVVVVRFDDATEFVNFEKTKEIQPPTGVLVKYKTIGPDKVATYIKKTLVTLPGGVTEIKTEEVAELVAKGSVEGDYCLIDSRPAKIAAAEHIPTAVSIPVDVLEEKGEKLLPCNKDKLIIFYCGGVT
jgi:hypothetical protein